MINIVKMMYRAATRKAAETVSFYASCPAPRGEMAQVVLNNLFKHTQMQGSFGVIMLAIVSGKPRVMNIKEMLRHFIQHRRDVVTRRTRFELRKAKERAHILEGLKIALDNLDEIIKLIRKANGPEEARNGLIEGYSLSKAQAQAILDMKLQRLTGLERQKIVDEYMSVMKEIEYLTSILDSDKLLDGIIRDELVEINEKHSNPRRTEITGAAKEIIIEDMITEEEMVITISSSVMRSSMLMSSMWSVISVRRWSAWACLISSSSSFMILDMRASLPSISRSLAISFIRSL